MISPSTTLEERVAKLEEVVAQLQALPPDQVSGRPWWETIAGSFEDSLDYDEAMRLGRAYRESLRPSEAQSDDQRIQRK